MIQYIFPTLLKALWSLGLNVQLTCLNPCEQDKISYPSSNTDDSSVWICVFLQELVKMVSFSAAMDSVLTWTGGVMEPKTAQMTQMSKTAVSIVPAGRCGSRPSNRPLISCFVLVLFIVSCLTCAPQVLILFYV